ncbi:putative OTU domain-containing protein 6 [Blattamonas nauphoetae]|uniref:Ubiquitin thioesterase OTU n=1 Tax=Blattamonas nauphoetae TaxID=2049346 RepID=A0ABQ9X971_9EUKA|nr:putative OTU domain-containing protein 6 [Blattamonas nauphoetae]
MSSNGSDSEDMPKEESAGKMKQRHFKEKKELEKLIASMRRSCPKKDVLKFQQNEQEIASLVEGLEARHQAEISSLTSSKTDTSNVSHSQIVHPPRQKVTRAQKRRAKSKAINDQYEQSIQSKDEDSSTFVQAQIQELESITKSLHSLSLTIHQVPPDGSCLFHAVIHQILHPVTDELRQRQSTLLESINQFSSQSVDTQHKQTSMSYEMRLMWRLRAFVAHHILNNPEKHPFVTLTEEVSSVSDYCERIRTTGIDCGDLELSEIAKNLNIHIVVHAKQENHHFGEPTSPTLHLTFQEYYLTQGSHYTSTAIMTE